MLYEPDRRFVERLRKFDPELRCIWDRRKCSFVIQRQSKTFTRGRGWIHVLTVGPELRNGAPADIGSGDALIRKLTAMDDRRKFKSFDDMWDKEYAQPEKDVASKDRHEEEDFEVDLVHGVEDTSRMRHHVSPTAGTAKSFSKE